MRHREHVDPAPRRKLELPPGYSAAELHSHTVASDGMVTAVHLVEAAAQVGLSVICITDHDVIGDLEAATLRGTQLGVDVVRGEEVTTMMPPGTHIIGLFLKRSVRMGMSVADTVDAIHDQGGLAIVAHPFMPTYFASMSERRFRTLLQTHSVDGVELRHTAPVRAGTWKRLDEFFAEHRDRIGAVVGAGDSHFGIHDLARIVTIFPGRGAADLRRAIENGTTSWQRGVQPPPPSLWMRVRQQHKSLWWLNRERRHGRVGRGTGPHRPHVGHTSGGQGVGTLGE